MVSQLSGMPGSAGCCRITVADSTAITPTGRPPSRARPVTTVRAQPAWLSSQLPRSNSPLCQALELVWAWWVLGWVLVLGWGVVAEAGKGATSRPVG